MTTETLLTEPWEHVPVRRGDPLGLLAEADRYAELIGPGLSARTIDARWLTILAWCLLRSHAVWERAGGRALASSEEAQVRYAWLRPLELMWVDHALDREDGATRQLPGRRALTRWRNEGRENPRFGMTERQYLGYRQGGPYGAYRVILRRVGALTKSGDGWTPDALTHRLAAWMTAELGDDANVTMPAKAPHIDPSRWWLTRGISFGSSQRTVPTPLKEARKLPEHAIHRRVLFDEKTPGGRRRVEVAKVAARYRTADELELYEHIVERLRKDNVSDAHALAGLPDFARLTHSAIALLNELGAAMGGQDGHMRMDLAALAKKTAIDSASRTFTRCAKHRPGILNPRDRPALDSLLAAAAQLAAAKRIEALVAHHERFGGGKQWLALDGKSVVNIIKTDGRASSYGFRLRSVTRMAVQAGVVEKMPEACIPLGREEHDEGDES